MLQLGVVKRGWDILYQENCDLTLLPLLPAPSANYRKSPAWDSMSLSNEHNQRRAFYFSFRIKHLKILRK